MAETEIVLEFGDDTLEEFEALCIHRDLDPKLLARDAMVAIGKAMQAGACYGESIEAIYAFAASKGAPARSYGACDHRPLGHYKVGVDLVTAITYAMKFGVDHKEVLFIIDMSTAYTKLTNMGFSFEDIQRTIEKLAATGTTAVA